MDVVTRPNPWELTNNFRGLSGCLTADSADRDRRSAGMSDCTVGNTEWSRRHLKYFDRGRAQRRLRSDQVQQPTHGLVKAEPPALGE